jgi:ABC-type methionine transport system ATPase subunit
MEEMLSENARLRESLGVTGNMTPLLRADALFHHRSPPGELCGVSLGIEGGRFTLLTGDGAAGVLLRVIGLLERADEGEVWFDARAAGGLDEAELMELRNRHFGFLFAEPFLLDSFSVAENVAMPLFKIACLDLEQARARTAEVLGFTGLGAAADVTVSELAEVDQQRVALARALAIGPRVLIAENVGMHLGADEVRDFAALLRLVPETLGITLIATSPATPDVLAADREVRLEKGVIVGDSQPMPVEEAPAHE